MQAAPAEAQFAQARQDVILRVAQAYFDVLGMPRKICVRCRRRKGDRAAARAGEKRTSRSAPRPSSIRTKPSRALISPRRRKSPPTAISKSSGERSK